MQYEVVQVKVNVFLNDLILYDLHCIKCTKE